MSDSSPTSAESSRLAEVARDRVRFEEEALELSDQVYRVARRLVGSRAQRLLHQILSLLAPADEAPRDPVDLGPPA